MTIATITPNPCKTCGETKKGYHKNCLNGRKHRRVAQDFKLNANLKFQAGICK